MKVVFIAAMMAASSSAIAFGGSAQQGQAQGQIQGQAQGQVQGQHQGMSSVNRNANRNANANLNASKSSAASAVSTKSKQANKQSTSYTEAKQDYNDMYEDYVSAAIAGNVQPTVPCLVPINAGVVVPAVGSISAGSGSIDRGCEMRETIRIGMSSGDTATQSMANAVLQNMLMDMLNEQAEVESPVVESTSPISQIYESDFIGG